MAASTGDTDAAVRQSAAVYFKNLINKRYDPYDETRVTPLSDDDKAKIKQLLVPAVIGAVAAVRY